MDELGMGEKGQVAAVPATSSGQLLPRTDAMVGELVVEQIVAALARGERVSAAARAYGIDRTVRAWRRRGGPRPRKTRPTVSQLDPYRTWLEARAPEVDFNASVLCRELRERGFRGSVIIVRRAVAPLRADRTPTATVRCETAPGAQAQVDFGQVRVWIGFETITGGDFPTIIDSAALASPPGDTGAAIGARVPGAGQRQPLLLQRVFDRLQAQRDERLDQRQRNGAVVQRGLDLCGGGER